MAPSPEELGALMQRFYLQLGAFSTGPGSRGVSECVSEGVSEGVSGGGLSALIKAINDLEDALLPLPHSLTHTHGDQHRVSECVSEAVVVEHRVSECVSECVSEEVVRDCQRKAAAAVRVQWAEHVRTLIFTCRKQLRARATHSLTHTTTTSKDSSVCVSAGVGGGHSQRHLNAMVELLGA
jgi:hypothetical protein